MITIENLKRLADNVKEKFVSIKQGKENYGKILAVNEDGNTETMSAPESMDVFYNEEEKRLVVSSKTNLPGNVSVDPTLSVSGNAADAKAVGNAVSGVIKYNEAQELTDEERAQARANIDAQGFNWHECNPGYEYTNYVANVGTTDMVTDWDNIVSVESLTTTSTNALDSMVSNLRNICSQLTVYNLPLIVSQFASNFKALYQSGYVKNTGKLAICSYDDKAHEYSTKILYIYYNNSKDSISIKDQLDTNRSIVIQTDNTVSYNSFPTYKDSTLSMEGVAADAKAVGDRFNQLSEEVGKLINGTSNESKTKLSMVSFVDDDCKSETYTTLYPSIYDSESGEMLIPYTLACPPGNIGDDDYMTETQLKEMYDVGFEISCHHWRQYNMTDITLLPTKKSYEEDIQKCFDKFEEWGFKDVISISYPQGKNKYEYMSIPKLFFKMGFTVDRGINEVPYESYYMKRCEVFPSNGKYTLDDAKAMVDEVVTSGGWLIFMTHAWYDTFNADELLELIEYVQTAGIEIVGVNEAIKKTGNVIEVGRFKKPLEERAYPFFVVDMNGRIWANSLKLCKKADVEYEELTASYYTGSYVNPSGSFKTGHSDVNRTVSEKISVKAGEVYLLTCSAIYQQALYVIGAEIEGSNSITALDINTYPNAYRIPLTNTAEGIDGDTILTDYEVTIPADGFMYVSSNRNIQPEGFVIKKRI